MSQLNAEDIPLELQKRLQALQNLQIQTYQLDADFHKAVYNLDREFQKKHDNLYQKRLSIIMGVHEPTDEEWLMADSVNLLQGLKLLSLTENLADGEKIQGIPNFWLTILKADSIVGKLVYPADEPILTHLMDIRVQSRAPPNYAFVIEFHFSPNKYFANEMLTKEYLLQCTVDTDDPFDFDGPEIYKSIGCEIQWKSGMDLTEDARGAASNEFLLDQMRGSFFNIFKSSQLVNNEEGDVSSDYLNSVTTLDFEVGLYLKEKIVPSAILFYLDEKAIELDGDKLSNSGTDYDDDEGETYFNVASDIDELDAKTNRK